MFPQSVLEKIGYYVYFLQDPRDGKIFYIGKGSANRIFEHIQRAADPNTNQPKDALIRAIGLDKVKLQILRHGLTEQNALIIESACIDLLGLQNLHNQVKGHHSFVYGIKSIEEIKELYDSKPVQIVDKVILITINKYFDRKLAPEELYKITSFSWRVSARRNNAQYAFSVYKGIVREVYLINKWQATDTLSIDKGRWYFEGELAPDEIRTKYIGGDVSNYVGARYPIKYINC
jgi:uncharacterized protein